MVSHINNFIMFKSESDDISLEFFCLTYSNRLALTYLLKISKINATSDKIVF